MTGKYLRKGNWLLSFQICELSEIPKYPISGHLYSALPYSGLLYHFHKPRLSRSHCSMSSYVEDSLSGPPATTLKAVHVRFLHQLKTVCGTAQASSNCSEIPESIGTLLKSVTVSVRSKQMYGKPAPVFIAYSRVCAYAGRYFCHLDPS